MKLLAEMPKITKCLKCLKLRSALGGSILNWELKIGNYSIFMIFGFHTPASLVDKKDGAQRHNHFRHFSPPPAD